MKRVIAVILVPLLTAFSCGPNLRSNDIESIIFTDPDGHHILATNADVDQMALDIAAFLRGRGFEVSHMNKSYGVAPWTGHAQAIQLSLSSNERVLALIFISKCCIETTFRELETAVGSDAYAATPEQQQKIRELRPLVESFIRIKLKGFDRPNDRFNTDAGKPAPLSAGVSC